MFVSGLETETSVLANLSGPVTEFEAESVSILANFSGPVPEEFEAEADSALSTLFFSALSRTAFVIRIIENSIKKTPTAASNALVFPRNNANVPRGKNAIPVEDNARPNGRFDTICLRARYSDRGNDVIDMIAVQRTEKGKFPSDSGEPVTTRSEEEHT